MSEAPAGQKGMITLQKRHIAIALLVLQIWPWLVVRDAQRMVPVFQNIFRSLLKGGPVPLVTDFVIQTY